MPASRSTANRTRTAGGSLTEETYCTLRADILAGRLAPAMRLRTSKLAKELGVSLNVVREALSRLGGEGLVVSSAQVGFTVTAISAEDLHELTEVRLLVETAAIRRSIEHGDLAWESALVAAHHRLANTPMSPAGRPDDLTDDWMQAHNAFHLATMSGCSNSRLVALVASLGESATLYRHLSQHLEHGRRDIAGEHQGIFEATVARDGERASRSHAEHIQRTADIVRASLSAEDGSAD